MSVSARANALLSDHAPSIVAFTFMAGNFGLLLRRGFHPNLETAVGLLWIASDYALRQKFRHPITAPRINAAGITLGSLLLSASGLHHAFIDWNRVRTPLGYIPAALSVGFQHELCGFSRRLANAESRLMRLSAAILKRPYTMAAVLSAYGVLELTKSALHRNDIGLVAISMAYGVGSATLPWLDYSRLK
jgi:hypothetical protein